MMSLISFTISAKCEKKKDGGNMRKLISLFLVVIFFLILNSCNYDPYDSRDRGAIFADLWGECTFSADSFTLHVDKTRDTIFNGTVDELTFLRTEK